MREGSGASSGPGIEAADDAHLVHAWINAAKREDVRAAIAKTHDEIARAIASRSPRCEMSGRCCRFEEFGHRLYVTGLEAALTLVGAGAIAQDRSNDIRTEASEVGRRPGCVFQVGNTCGVHTHRPAGCRVYFCDPTWAPAMNDVAERAVERVRAIHDELAIPYRYMEWRALLSMFDACAGPLAISRELTNQTPPTPITHNGETPS